VVSQLRKNWFTVTEGREVAALNSCNWAETGAASTSMPRSTEATRTRKPMRVLESLWSCVGSNYGATQHQPNWLPDVGPWLIYLWWDRLSKSGWLKKLHLMMARQANKPLWKTWEIHAAILRGCLHWLLGIFFLLHSLQECNLHYLVETWIYIILNIIMNIH
jgi:hypothetical protein